MTVLLFSPFINLRKQFDLSTRPGLFPCRWIRPLSKTFFPYITFSKLSGNYSKPTKKTHVMVLIWFNLTSHIQVLQFSRCDRFSQIAKFYNPRSSKCSIFQGAINMFTAHVIINTTITKVNNCHTLQSPFATKHSFCHFSLNRHA